MVHNRGFRDSTRLDRGIQTLEKQTIKDFGFKLLRRPKYMEKSTNGVAETHPCFLTAESINGTARQSST
jgi:hypothetical protein